MNFTCEGPDLYVDFDINRYVADGELVDIQWRVDDAPSSDVRNGLGREYNVFLGDEDEAEFLDAIQGHREALLRFDGAHDYRFSLDGLVDALEAVECSGFLDTAPVEPGG